MSQFDIEELLRARPGLTIPEISARLKVSESSITKAINRSRFIRREKIITKGAWKFKHYIKE